MFGIDAESMPTNLWCEKTRVDADYDFTEQYGALDDEYHSVFTGVAERGGATNDALVILTIEPWVGPLAKITCGASLSGTGNLTITPLVGAPSTVSFTDAAAALSRVLVSDPRNGDTGGTANLKYMSTIGLNAPPQFHRDTPALDGGVVTGSVGFASFVFSDYDTSTTVFTTDPDLSVFLASGYANFTLS